MNAFEKIAGYEKEKAELAALVEIFNNRKKYEAKGARPPKGIIFYGEAGTGKTLFANVLATECKLNKMEISLSESASDNSICRQIRKAFMKGARGNSPTMIFFDELDKVLPNSDEKYYSDRSKTILAQLLTLLDGMESITNIIFVATCNNYSSLPPSLTRAGRFDKKIALGIPDQASRTAILNMYIDASPASFAMGAESIARLCAGFSCAALKTLVNECLLRSDENNFVSEELIRSKITEIKDEDLPTERSVQSYTVDATRNLGAFVVSRTYSNSSYMLTTDDCTVCNSFLDKIISDSDFDDDYEGDYDEERYEKKAFDGECDSVYSKNDYLAAITALLGGYAAEEIVFNKLYSNLECNVKAVDRILIKMAECGLLGLELVSNYDYRYTNFPYPTSYWEQMHQIFQKTMLECYGRAKELVEKNTDLITELTPILISRKTIEKKDCERIITELGGIRT